MYIPIQQGDTIFIIPVGTVKEYFDECGGLQYILDLLSSTTLTQVREAAVYCLGCCVERDGKKLGLFETGYVLWLFLIFDSFHITGFWPDTTSGNFLYSTSLMPLPYDSITRRPMSFTFGLSNYWTILFFLFFFCWFFFVHLKILT